MTKKKPYSLKEILDAKHFSKRPVMKKKTNKKIDKPILSVESAVGMLDYVYSVEDPIWVDDIEMTPRTLEYVLDVKYDGAINEYDSKLLKIEFYRMRDECGKKSRGTLFSMVLDRMGAW